MMNRTIIKDSIKMSLSRTGYMRECVRRAIVYMRKEAAGEPVRRFGPNGVIAKIQEKK